MPNDYGPDVANRVAVNSRRLVPDGPAPTGHRLTVVGQEPFQFAWRQPEEKQVREGNGDPNGVVTAPKSTLYVERDAPSLWQNSDGLTAWTEIGSGGGGSTPTDWVQWEATLDTGIVDSASHHVVWDDSSSSGLTHGTAITLNGSGDAEVAEDGWYTLDYYVMVEGETNGAVWNGARLRTDITRSFTLGGDAQSPVISLIEFLPTVGGFPKANMPFSWTGYLMAGDTLEAHARMTDSSVGSDTFKIGDGQFRMEKLPL